jgi:hypothetical protein
MGFFKRLFRRKKAPSSTTRYNKQANNTTSALTEDQESPLTKEQQQQPSEVPIRPRGPDLSDGSQAPRRFVSIGSPKSPNGSLSSPSRATGPVDLDATPRNSPVQDEFNETDFEQDGIAAQHPQINVQLSLERLQEFNKSNSIDGNLNSSNLRGSPPQLRSPQPIFAMDMDDTTTYNNNGIRFSAGQHMHDPNNSNADSDGESSSFNLSTDAEDADYENLRRRGVLPLALRKASDDVSFDQQTAVTTDGETSVFANLIAATEDDTSTLAGNGPKATEAQQQTQPQPSWTPNKAANTTPNSLLRGPTTEDHDALFDDDFANFADFANVAFSNEPLWDTSATTADSPTKTTRFPATATTTSPAYQTAAAAASTSSPTFEKTSAVTSPTFQKTVTASSPTSYASTSPTYQKSSAATSPTYQKSSAATSPTYQKTSAAASPTTYTSTRPSYQKTSTGSPAVHTENTSLSDLLAQAKSKSSSLRRTTGSVNSAPVSSAYVRQHQPRTTSDGAPTGGASVTDIIHSLEAANASRGPARQHRRTVSRGDDNVSLQSRDNASVISAKERLRRRRIESARQAGDSDESEEANEDWLMDEVTGALGPRGIAADLESLSGRSNRSKSSGRSHKSHRRRTPKSGGNDSVSTHGSRRSRYSQKSHRSTRSYISQMSEQSRSVANDLLRLEMQLAMVGSNDDPKRSASSVGGTSRRSSRSNIHRRTLNTARRTRITVLAPPGKLGIILANKADAKGTVVSGVRTSSVMAEKISPGDRIVAIDGEDVSLMTVSEITTIMARKNDFERTLTVMTTPKVSSEPHSPRANDYTDHHRYRQHESS